MPTTKVFLMIYPQVRFLHDPVKDTGFAACAFASNIVRFLKKPDETWGHEVAISVKPLKVQNWIQREMPGLITYFLISLDDRFIYLSNWFHGDIRQYNVEDPANPRLVGQVWVGGIIKKGSPVVAEAEDGTTYQTQLPQVQVRLFCLSMKCVNELFRCDHVMLCFIYHHVQLELYLYS